MPDWVEKAHTEFKTYYRFGDGYGKFALFTACRVPAFSLHASRDAAEEAKRMVDTSGCGGKCPVATRASKHRIVELAPSEKQK